MGAFLPLHQSWSQGSHSNLQSSYRGLLQVACLFRKYASLGAVCRRHQQYRDPLSRLYIGPLLCSRPTPLSTALRLSQLCYVHLPLCVTIPPGTVEFILDTDTGQFFFMEMNTRLQAGRKACGWLSVDCHLRLPVGILDPD